MTIAVVRPPQPALTPAPQGQPTTHLRKRDRYIDSLRALALIRVMTYHVFGWAWLPILFPSIGIMFALAGSLIAGSLDRSPGNPWRVLKKRGIRLLPPVWLFGLVVVPTMLVAGWTFSETAGAPLSWQTLLFWVLPISDPPGSALGADWVSPLWYIRTYLWFLLLSPAILWLFRHWPRRMLALPVIVVVLAAVGLFPLSGRSGDVILSIAMFGGCWMLGFAHHDNKIRALPLAKVLLGGALLMALGLLWAFAHPDPVTGYDIDNIPLANTLYCLGAVLILLRLYPDFSWMDKRVVLDKLVTVISSRAMTIYLWGNFAIFLAIPLLDSWSVTANLDQDNAVGYVQMYIASWLIVIAAVFLFGWCEDLAARRPLRINPWPRSKQQLDSMRTHKVLTFPRPTWLTDLTPKRMFIITSYLLVFAAGMSTALLAGTNTPGRATTADAPPRYAVNPRPLTTPPANLGQGNGQGVQLGQLLPKIKGVLEDIGNGSTTPRATLPAAVPSVPALVPPVPAVMQKVPAPVLPTTGPVATVPSPVPGPVPPVPGPVPTVPDPVPTVPDPVPTVPDPVPTVPDPVPTVPDPVPTVPDPVPTVPDPVPTVPDPVPTVPDPVPTVPDSVPTVADPVPTVADPVPTAVDPAPTTAG